MDEIIESTNSLAGQHKFFCQTFCNESSTYVPMAMA